MKLEGFYIRQHRNVAKQFLPSGGVHVLAGRNGAGKTSILSAIALVGDYPNPLSGVSELDLKPGEDNSSQVFRIYGLDEDLSGDFIDETDNGTKCLRSGEAVELVFSALGPSALQNVVTIVDDVETGPWVRLDMEQLRLEWDRAIDLFRHYGVESLFAQEGPNILIDALSKPSQELFEAEFCDLVSSISIEASLVFKAIADQLLDLLVRAKQIAWSGGYRGLVINRSDIPIELGESLTRLSNWYPSDGTFIDSGGFWEHGKSGEHVSIEIYFLEKEVLASTTGYGRGTVPPVVNFARQWVGNEPILILSLSPDVGQAPPYEGRVMGIGPVKPPKIDSETRMRYRSALDGGDEERDTRAAFDRFAQRHLVRPLITTERQLHIGYLSNGPDALATVVASGDATGLAEEIESALPTLFNHVWSFVTSVAVGVLAGPKSIVQLLPPDQQFLFSGDDRRQLGVLAMTSVETVGLRQPEISVDPWMVSIDDKDAGGLLRRSYLPRPGVNTACSLLAYKANEIAPLFIQSAGLIEIDARIVPITGGGPSLLLVEYDGKPLNELPAGTARWVAITVRLAARLLLQSKVLLREVWGSDYAEMQTYLGDLNPDQMEALERMPDGVARYGILRHAVEVLERADGYLDFEVVPDYRSEAQTVLLVDEPELHLHQDALLDIRKWLRDRTAEGDITAVIATHSPVFMDYLPHEASVHGLLTAPDGGAVVTDMTRGLGTWLDGDAEALGVASLDGLFSFRGFLLVEGKHDEIVLRQFYGEDLARRRLGVVAMWGTRGKLDLTEARFLQLVRRPVAMLLDNIPEGESSSSETTAEKRDLLEFIESFKREGIRFCGEGHGLQDIIYALPEAGVQRLCEEQIGTPLPDGKWGEIGELIRTEFRYSKSQEKKRKAQELLGLRPTRHGLSANNFIRPVLDNCESDDRPHESLERAMRRILGFFESQDRYA